MPAEARVAVRAVRRAVVKECMARRVAIETKLRLEDELV